MWLPTKAQIDAASRHAISIAGTAIVIFGLQAKGITIEQVTSVIQSLGSTANDLVVLAASLAPLYAMLKASHTASPTSQAAAVAATGAKVVTTPEIAAAVPSGNVMSETDVQVVSK